MERPSCKHVPVLVPLLVSTAVAELAAAPQLASDPRAAASRFQQ